MQGKNININLNSINPDNEQNSQFFRDIDGVELNDEMSNNNSSYYTLT